MNGMLADVNLQGHLPYVRRLLVRSGLMPLLDDTNLRLVTFPELGLDRRIDDRSLWNVCQQGGWVLFTENRNQDGPDSLEATLADSWTVGCLPVVTLANKGTFENSPDYAARVADELAEILIDVADGGYRDQPRIYVPRAASP